MYLYLDLVNMNCRCCASIWSFFFNLKIESILSNLVNFTENKPKKELIQMLVRRGYDSDPLKRWKELQAKDKVTHCIKFHQPQIF